MTSKEERLERIRQANAGKPKTFPQRELPPMSIDPESGQRTEIPEGSNVDFPYTGEEYIDFLM